MSYKQVYEAQLGILAKLDTLEGLLEEFNKLVERLTDENHATNAIHKDLMIVVRESADYISKTSEFMERVPTLLNELIKMLTNERMTLTDGWKEIEDIKEKVTKLWDFVEHNHSTEDTRHVNDNDNK